MATEKRSTPVPRLGGRLEIRLPGRLARWVPSYPWLSVQEGRVATLATGRTDLPLSVHQVPASLTDDQLAELVGHFRATEGPHLVVGPYLRQSLRELLERIGMGYLDSRGHLHLIAPGVAIHLGDSSSITAPRLKEAAVLGVNGVRAVQALLESREPVSVTSLAALAELSPSQTHAVMNALERHALVRTEGKGPAKRRSVIDRTSLLDWLADQPAARRRERYLEVALYARRPEDLWGGITEALNGEKIPHALTGAAAASLFGVGPTNVLVSTVRISPDVPLEVVARKLGAEPTERGPNVRLMRDTGRVGVVGSEVAKGVRVSPKARIYLDTLGERRGEDLAQQFREVVLGY